MRLRFLIFMIISATVFTACDGEHEEHMEGHMEAKRDIAQKTLKVAFTDSEKVPAFWEYTGLLRNRYHIGWCIHSLRDNPRLAEEWVKGYNEEMLPQIERQFGTNILQETMAEAQKAHEGTAVKKK